MCRNVLQKVVAGMALAVALTIGTQAEALTFTLDQEFSGGTAPAGSPPWLTAVFAQQGANTVRLTMTATNLTGNEFIDEWLFNLNPLKDPTDLTFTHFSGETAVITTVADNTNSIPADGGGYYDIQFDFPQPQSSRFGVGDQSVYDITLAGLLESDFNFLAAPHGGNGVFHTAAHVLGIGTNDESGWIGDSNGNGNGNGNGEPPPIPEPSTFLLFAAGLGSVAFLRKRRLNSIGSTRV